MTRLTAFTTEQGKDVWINPAHVARVEEKSDGLSWVWFAYADGECDVAVQGTALTVATTLNIALAPSDPQGANPHAR